MAGHNRKYKYLLLDVDDTLMDFKKIEAEALQKLFEYYGHSLTDDLLQTYHSVNRGLWADYEQGKVAMGHMLQSRFGITMGKFGVQINSVEWEKSYQAMLGEGSHVIDDAKEVCERLGSCYRLFVITNGVRETQHRRLAGAGLYDLFEDVFDSQSIGYSKPAKEFFDYVTAHIAGFEKQDALVIGDSLITDIRGGIAAGIDTCWFNRHPDKSAGDLPITYTITKLADLFGILGMTDEG